MLNVLYKNINFDNVKYIGFDMDGTLYDEYDFISQVYKRIAYKCCPTMYEAMLNRWLEKSSSYNKIFEEAYLDNISKFKIPMEEFVDKCFDIYMNYDPVLSLNNRVKYILQHCKDNYEIFVVTDGNAELQQRKFKALGLDKYFKPDNVFYTGAHGREYYKPSHRICRFMDNINFEESVFFGDRTVDRDFALTCGMQFHTTNSMIGLDND